MWVKEGQKKRGCNVHQKMSSPKQITTSEILINQKSCNDHKININQYQIVPPNNGFITKSSSLLLNAFRNSVKLLSEPVDVHITSMDKSNDFSTIQSGHQSPVNRFCEDARQNINFYGSNVIGTKCNDDNLDAHSVEIVVVSNRDFDKRRENESDIISFKKEESKSFQKVLKSEDIKIVENSLICTPPELSAEIQKPSKISKCKLVSSSSIKNSFPYNWYSKRSKLEKYLTCAIIVLVLLLSLFIMYLIFSSKLQSLGSEKKVCLTRECISTAASLLSAMDLTVHPCQDFFQFACGSWNKQHVIPEDKSSINTFEVMADQLQVILKSVLEEQFESRENNHSATRKAKLFYKSCMDIRQIRKTGDAPLRKVLKQLGGWPVATPNWKPPNFSIETLLGKLRGEFNEGVLVEQWVGPDDKNSSAHILQLDQMQLALPSRDYYLKHSSNAELKGYHKYMTQVAVLLGANAVTASKELEEVVKFEIKLANATLHEADRHDTSAMYRKLSLNALQKEIPALNWKEYLSTLLGTKINEKEPVVSYAMPYFIELEKILKETDRRVVHNYVIWRLVMKIVPHMVDEYQQVITDFRKILLGILTERHRWSQCVDWTNKKLGMAVGALFIKDNFNHNSKEMALEMIHTIREAFNELLEENMWMDDETRLVAKEKADSMNERIGYPDLLTDEEELNKEYMNVKPYKIQLTITDDQFLVNVFNVLKYDANHNLQKLRQPVNKDKWSTEPAVVNAFYNPNKNDIVFPAGILQPLFYSQYFPKSLNYGGIGVVIGHEITHGFDDKGRQFDKDGNMMQWWNNATIKAFRKRTQCIIDQYSRYKLDEIDLFVNGRMTQGENIADNGGLKQSFRAYKKWVAKHGEEPLLPGMNMTHDQLFFLNYAQIWCGSMRPEDALSKIRSSVHSPGPVRVWGPLSNSWDFAKAFNCPPTSPMNPTNKCTVW